MSTPFKNYKRKLRWRSSIRKVAAHGLIPCPACGGDLQHDANGNYFYCADCPRKWPDTENNRSDLLPNTPCPKCGRRMYFRDGASLGRMWPDGAWECESGDYNHMFRPEELVPDTYQDPDAPGDFTLPEGFQ